MKLKTIEIKIRIGINENGTGVFLITRNYWDTLKLMDINGITEMI